MSRKRTLRALIPLGVILCLRLVGGSVGYADRLIAGDPASIRRAEPDAAAVQIGFEVSAATRAILSDDGRVREVWSNTRDHLVAPTFHRDHLGGPPVEPTDAALQAYRAVAWRIDWSHAPGRVYRASDSPVDRLVDAAASVLSALLPGGL